MHDIKTLGNTQLGLHYEVIYQKLNDIKIEIIEDITDILGKNPGIDIETYQDQKKFHNYCTSRYRSSIQQENKEILEMLLKQEQDIQEEIQKRQKDMLKEIGIIAPSIRVDIITEKTRGANFPMFNDMIRYIKLAQQGKLHERPKNRKIYAPRRLIETFEKLGTTPLVALAQNLGPLQS